MTLKMLIDTFTAGDASLQPEIENYISAQALLQTVANPSGDLTDGSGLGELNSKSTVQPSQDLGVDLSEMDRP